MTLANSVTSLVLYPDCKGFLDDFKVVSFQFCTSMLSCHFIRQLGVTATKNLKRKNALTLINTPRLPGEEFLVGILLPPSLLGRAPSRGPHGLFRCTADRPQVLQPSSSLPRPTDHAQGKLIKPQPTEARSECAAQGTHQGIAPLDESFTHSLRQESNCGLEDRPFPSSPQFMMDVAKRTPSEANLNVTVNAQEPYHLAKNQPSDMQFVATSLQTAPQSSTVDQAERVGQDQSPPVGYPSQPKSLQLLKPSILNSLAPPPESESSANRTPPTCKKSLIIAPCHSAKLQPTSSPTNLASNLKVSKLRPPSCSFKQKQVSTPRIEPQNVQAKTSIPRPLTRQKEIMQNPNGNLHPGDCLASNRYSRLPKPKIH
uniref:Coiled-coil serine rich protein 2 n=1 Tax=Oryctolagus cuniculus TaxID=9986 RepID=A0A5F9CJS2_RABIT